jgi:single-strand DNA-binding protein
MSTCRAKGKTSMARAKKAHLVGNLTADPELRVTATGRPWATLRIAVNPRCWNRYTRQWEDGPATFHDVVCWSSTLAENVVASLKKGDLVHIIGRLQEYTWETPEGEKRYRPTINAEDVAPSLKWATADVTRKRPVSASPRPG